MLGCCLCAASAGCSQFHSRTGNHYIAASDDSPGCGSQPEESNAGQQAATCQRERPIVQKAREAVSCIRAELQPPAGTPLPPGVQSHSRFHPVPTHPVFLPRIDCEPVSGALIAPQPDVEMIPPGTASPQTQLSPSAPVPEDVPGSQTDTGPDRVTDTGRDRVTGTGSRDAGAAASEGSRSWIFTTPAKLYESPVVAARLPAEPLERGRPEPQTLRR